MKTGRRNIYFRTYMLVGVIIAVFFLHNALENKYYDVLHIEKTLHLLGQTFYIRDIFPYYDAPDKGYYGNTVRYDLQEYMYRISQKIIMLTGACCIYLLVQAFNVLAADLPGRTFIRMPKIMVLVVGLFAYDLADFIFTAGQTPWEIEVIIFYTILSTIVLSGKK
ncbi:hypothetical protein I2I11_04245 [Pontibacter sp. 172403-2]|uniref:hypothetical protein n=1 Tax=Pontibacter rufus TaxID=2791028 RepID=UPI0018AF791A|nr:hypothetical protein [Pontibacter sp. 172403-2]MBF9252495.1 hypothetical protein [Pontibacter sp. 172403-2]